MNSDLEGNQTEVSKYRAISNKVIYVFGKYK